MRVLWLNWHCWFNPEAGGDETVLNEVAKRWVQRGWDVHVLCAMFPGASNQQEVDGIRIIRVGGKYSLYFRAALRYIHRLRGVYDIVVDCINTIPFFTPLYINQPRVALIHQTAREILIEELPWGLRGIAYALELRLLELYRGTSFITVSASTKEDLVSVGVHPSRINVVTQGLDKGKYHRRKKASFPYIVYVGRIKKHKGVHFLIDCMERVVEELPTARLSIVGRGDYDLLATLKEMTVDRGLQDNITFHGFVSESEKIRIMQEAHVLAVPSRREGFGLVVLEAAACGTPSVGFQVPGLVDAIADNETGLLVPYGDTTKLAKAILKILANPDLRDSLGRRAAERASLFGWDEMADQMASVLESLVKSRGPKSVAILG